MMRWVLHAKLHNATVKDANVDYVGSIEIDEDLVDSVGLWVGERVLVVSNSSGARLETYIIAGERGSGMISMNGAAARLIGAGEQIIVMGFELAAQPITPKVVLSGQRQSDRPVARWRAERARLGVASRRGVSTEQEQANSVITDIDWRRYLSAC